MTIPVWQRTNGWREIFTRIFEPWAVQVSVYPEWLVNPQTNRRLKLDFLCHEIRLAIRLEGVEGSRKSQRPRRLSLEEEEQKQSRDDARVVVCRQHGIELLVIDVTQDSIRPIFRELDVKFSQIKRQVDDETVLTEINQSRAKASELARRVKNVEGLKLFADLWSDRQYDVPTSEQSAPAQTVTFTVGMDVEHAVFGLGTITEAVPSGNDTILTVDFLDVGPKTLAASLVADKLTPF